MSQRTRQTGISLINVLVAIMIFAFGLLGLAGIYANMTSVVSQNQNISQLAPIGNGFWGIVQANPTTLDALSALGNTTFGGSGGAAISTAPAALRPWLTQIISGSSPQNLGAAAVTIQPLPDPAMGTACASATGCQIVLTIAWQQNPPMGTQNQQTAVTRSQTFYYAFGI